MLPQKLLVGIECEALMVCWHIVCAQQTLTLSLTEHLPRARAFTWPFPFMHGWQKGEASCQDPSMTLLPERWVLSAPKATVVLSLPLSAPRTPAQRCVRVCAGGASPAGFQSHLPLQMLPPKWHGSSGRLTGRKQPQAAWSREFGAAAWWCSRSPKKRLCIFNEDLFDLS